MSSESQDGKQTALLSLAINGRSGESVLGNVFIVVEHEATGRKWRGLRYHLKTKSYVYQLPPGRFRFRVVAAGYETEERRVVLRAGCNRSVAVKLAPEIPNAPLIIDVGEELADYQQFARGLYRQRDARDLFGEDPAGTLGRHLSEETHLGPAVKASLSPNSEVLAALMCGSTVLDSLSQPTYSLVCDSLEKWLTSRLLGAWKFKEEGTALDQIVRPLVERRVRLYALLKALVRTKWIRARLPRLDEKKLTIHLLRFLASLDAPRIDNVIPILVQLLDPDLAPVERLARNLLQSFDVRVPAGTAKPADGSNSSRRGASEPDLASFAEQLLREEADMKTDMLKTDEEEVKQRLSALMFLLSEIAHCVVSALSYSPVYIEGLSTKRDYA